METPLARSAMYEGMEVEVRHSGQYDGTWRIVKINPVNIKLVSPSTGVRLNCAPSYIYAKGSSTTPAPVVATPSLPAGVTLGSIIELAYAPGKMPSGPDHLYVVIAIKYEQINVALMGGDAGRYWRLKAHSFHRIEVLGRGEQITL